MKLVITLDLDVDGAAPTEAQREEIEERIIADWPQWVYSYGDDQGALIVNFNSMEWMP